MNPTQAQIAILSVYVAGLSHEACILKEVLDERDRLAEAVRALDAAHAQAARDAQEARAQARREGMEAAARIAAERGAWASNDADAESLVDRLEARGRMDAASEIASAIRAAMGGKDE